MKFKRICIFHQNDTNQWEDDACLYLVLSCPSCGLVGTAETALLLLWISGLVPQSLFQSHPLSFLVELQLETKLLALSPGLYLLVLHSRGQVCAVQRPEQECNSSLADGGLDFKGMGSNPKLSNQWYLAGIPLSLPSVEWEKKKPSMLYFKAMSEMKMVMHSACSWHLDPE